jgi:hypothetical protein
MLARFLRQHPDVEYIGEPRPIWMYANAYRPNDILTATDVTPRIASHIHYKFAELLAASGKSRLVEKTPSNSLRIPFIHALYPDCRIVNIIRDGRGVVGSMLRIEERKPNKGSITSRLRETPVWEWPGYVPMFLRTVWRTNVLGRPAKYWGPRPPEWKSWITLPRHQSAALQWKAIVEISRRDGRALPPDNYLEIRYEDAVRDAGSVVERILAFANLAPNDDLVTWAQAHIQPHRPDVWRSSLSIEQQAEVLAIQKPLLEELGYLDPSSR